MAIACIAALSAFGCGDDDGDGQASRESAPITGELPRQADLLFVVRGSGTITNATIEVDTEAVEWFTDRPRRRAGVGRTGELVDNWEAYGFVRSPPNGAVAGAEVDAEVVLTEPEPTADGISFRFEEIRGELESTDAEQLSLFIDSTGDIEDSLSQVAIGQEVTLILTGGNQITGTFEGLADSGRIAVVDSDGTITQVPLDSIAAVQVPSG